MLSLARQSRGREFSYLSWGVESATHLLWSGVCGGKVVDLAAFTEETLQHQTENSGEENSESSLDPTDVSRLLYRILSRCLIVIIPPLLSHHPLSA